LLGDLVRRDVPLGPLTTYRVGGTAALFTTVESEDDLRRVRDAVSASRAPVLVIGKGSNLLVSDAGFSGLAVVLGDAFADIVCEWSTVRAGGAAALPVVARRSAAAGLRGFEWAVGVPGSIGGAVRMNAGGHGSDMAASLTRVHVVDLLGGHDGWVPVTDLELGYRRSRLRPTDVVVEAELALTEGDRATAEAAIAEIVRWRRENQPGGQNAGSVFTNPQLAQAPGTAATTVSAGQLIEEAGAKGLRVGTAQVSPKHANFIIADPGGRADDVWELMQRVRQLVADRQGITLEIETHLVGFPSNAGSEVEG
jgi:UDP-N-acetylmuramate dehydrogenase